ncbi:MAG: RDD family protein [Bacteroidetes bacterium]|nr:RDD family protein [Bacteroidota bacterium]
MAEEKINPGTRFGTMILDHFIMCFVMMIFAIPGIINGVSKAFNINHEQRNPDLFGDTIYIMIIGFAVYFCKDSIHGRSPGKRILKLQVVDNATGIAASPIKCFIRNLFCVLWPIEALVALVNTERRIGDFVAGTKLVPFEPTAEPQKLNWPQIGMSLLLGYVAMLLIMVPYHNMLSGGGKVNYIETSYNEQGSKALEQLFADSLGNKLTPDIKVYNAIEGEDRKYISLIFRLKKNYLVDDESYEQLKATILPLLYSQFPEETFVGRVQYVYQSGGSTQINTEYLDWRKIKR